MNHQSLLKNLFNIQVLAFLERPNLGWAQNVKLRHLQMYKANDDFRKRILSCSKSGGILLSAFGQKAFNHITWDNCQPDPVKTYANVEHMMNTIWRHNPQLILTFGKMAELGFQATGLTEYAHMTTSHPAYWGNHSNKENIHDFVMRLDETLNKAHE